MVGQIHNPRYWIVLTTMLGTMVSVFAALIMVCWQCTTQMDHYNRLRRWEGFIVAGDCARRSRCNNIAAECFSASAKEFSNKEANSKFHALSSIALASTISDPLEQLRASTEALQLAKQSLNTCTTAAERSLIQETIARAERLKLIAALKAKEFDRARSTLEEIALLCRDKSYAENYLVVREINGTIQALALTLPTLKKTTDTETYNTLVAVYQSLLAASPNGPSFSFYLVPSQQIYSQQLRDAQDFLNRHEFRAAAKGFAKAAHSAQQMHYPVLEAKALLSKAAAEAELKEWKSCSESLASASTAIRDCEQDLLQLHILIMQKDATMRAGDLDAWSLLSFDELKLRSKVYGLRPIGLCRDCATVCQSLSQFRHYKRAQELSLLWRDAAEKQGNKEHIILSWASLAKFAARNHDTKVETEANKTVQQLSADIYQTIRKAESKDVIKSGTTFLAIADQLAGNDQCDLASHYYEEAIERFSKDKDPLLQKCLFNALFHYGRMLVVRMDEPERAKKYLLDAAGLAQEGEVDFQTMQCSYLLGLAYLNDKNPAIAETYFKSALKQAKQFNDPYTASISYHMLNCLADTAAERHRFEEAIGLREKAVRTLPLDNPEKHRILYKVYIDIGQEYVQLGCASDPKKSLEPQIMSRIKSDSNVEQRAGLLYGLSKAYAGRGNTKRATELTEQALSLLKVSNAGQYLQALLLINLAELSEPCADADLVATRLKEGTSLAEKFGARQRLANICTYMGKLSIDYGRYDRAAFWLEQAARAPRNKATPITVLLDFQLARLNMYQGNTEAALQFANDGIALDYPKLPNASAKSIRLHLLVSRIELQRNNIDRAEKALQQALTVFPSVEFGDPDTAKEVQSECDTAEAAILIQRNKLKEARARLSAAIQKANSNRGDMQAWKYLREQYARLIKTDEHMRITAFEDTIGKLERQTAPKYQSRVLGL